MLKYSLIVVLFLSGCFKTELLNNFQDLHQERSNYLNSSSAMLYMPYNNLNKLANDGSNAKSKQLSKLIYTLTPYNQKVIGNQYALFLLQFGRVYLDNPWQPIISTLKQHLLQIRRDLTPLKEANEPEKKEQLKLAIKEITVNAWDFLIVRKIECRFALKVDYNSTEILNSKFSRWSSFGFSRELTHTLQNCLDRAAEKAIEKLKFN